MRHDAARSDRRGLPRRPPDPQARAWNIRQQAEIDELRAARDLMEERLAHYAELYEGAPVAYLTLGPRGSIRDINLEGARLLGRKRGMLIGRPFSLFVAPGHLTRLLGHLRRMRRGAPSATADLRLRTAGGPVDVRMLAVAAPGGGPPPAACRAVLVETPGSRGLLEERDRLMESERIQRVRVAAALRRLQGIRSVTSGLHPHWTPDERLREILTRVRLALGADGAAVVLRQRNGAEFAPGAADHRPGGPRAQASIPPSRAIARRVAARQQPVILEDLSKERTIEPALRRLAGSLIAVPLLVEDRSLGALQVASRRRGRFGEDDLPLLELAAERIAAAIDRARLTEEVRAGRERLVALSSRILDVEERERRAIASELHDEIGQLLTGLLCLLESEDRAHAGGAAEAGGGRGRRRRLRRIKGLVGEAMRRVRGLCMNLRPAGLERQDLRTTLRWYFERYTAQTGVRVRLDSSVNGRRLPSVLQAACFRIIQESLTNVARHARAEEVRVGIRAGSGRINLEIQDRGRGFDVPSAARRPTCGLSGMRERALLLGGDLAIHSARGAGTTIAAVLPIPGGKAARPARARPAGRALPPS